MSITLRIRNGTLVEGESLCRSCRWVHMQRGFRESEETIFCNWGDLRPVRFKVAECTEYSDRTMPSRHEMEEMALEIPVSVKRKAAGFVTVPRENAEHSTDEHGPGDE